LKEEPINLPNAHHDFTVLPDGAIIFVAHGESESGGGAFGDMGGCDRIMERSPTGDIHEIITSSDAHGESSCHINSVHYQESDDTITFSDTNPSCYIKVDREGNVIWQLGGSQTDFQVQQWDRNHGHHMMDDGNFLLFNNGSMGGAATSKAIELSLDLNGMTTQRVWEYSQNGMSSDVLGDVQRLPNGNTLVTYSSRGMIQEVSNQGKVLRELSWQLGTALGYVMHRESLYGPPPK
jgi:hypothetical protein